MNNYIDELKNLIKEGKEIVINRPSKNEKLVEKFQSENEMKGRCESQKWFFKCINLIEKNFTNKSTEYIIFNNLYKTYTAINLGGTKSIDMEFCKEDMLLQISHLEAILENKNINFISPELTILHPKIIKTSKKLYEEGHYSEAVSNAFKIIENCVIEKSNINNKSGKDLMSMCFKSTKPILKIKTISQDNEQEGFMFLLMGAFQLIRNPLAHKNINIDNITAYEYLSLASMLIKKIEESEKI